MRLFKYALLLIFLQAFAESVWAVSDSALSENQIKAAYLYKFATYIEWPASAFPQTDSPVVIGIVGADEIATELNNLVTGRLVNGRVIQIKSLSVREPLSGVHILFIGQHERLTSLLESMQTQPVLIVTDTNNALDMGSIINFVLVDNHLRFEVSTAHADRCGLKISARLLGVAQKVETGRPL